MVIYKTTNLINGKFYVGKDMKNDDTYLGSGLILNNAIKKYGIDNFTKEILEVCDNLDHLNEREIYWIAKLDSTNKDIGYNIALGGNGGDCISQNPNRDKISANISNSLKGRKFTSDHKKKISDAKKGIPTKSGWFHSNSAKEKMKAKRNMRGPISDETRKRMSESRKGRTPAKGYKHTDESKQKMSDASKHKLTTIVTNIETGEQLTFNSITSAASHFNCKRWRIRENKLEKHHIIINRY